MTLFNIYQRCPATPVIMDHTQEDGEVTSEMHTRTTQ